MDAGELSSGARHAWRVGADKLVVNGKVVGWGMMQHSADAGWLARSLQKNTRTVRHAHGVADLRVAVHVKPRGRKRCAYKLSSPR